MARLARVVAKAGYFTIENPERSYVWQFAPLAALARLPGVSLILGDQCCHGGPYQKGTCWLTNAPWA
eukprot:14030985-Heterocapsa_arctica.AAC.1